MVTLAKTEKEKYELKSTIDEPKIKEINGLYISKGKIVLRNLADAESFRNNIQLATDDKILYGYVLITENSHHWSDPEPDRVLDRITFGDESNIVLFE